MNKELVQQLVFLTSILAGFTFSAVISLVLHERADEQKKWFESATIIAFTLASAFLVWTTVALGFLLLGPDEFSQSALQNPALQNILNQSQIWGLIAFGSGYTCFMVGLGLIGWWHSKTVGVVTSVAALITWGLLANSYFQIAPLLTSS